MATLNDVRRIALAFPGTSEHGSYGGTASWKVGGYDRRRDVYFTTPHFDGYSAVLMGLNLIGLQALEDVMYEAWLAKAPKRLVAMQLGR